MPFDRAKTALATLEEKLRRALGLAGAINASFTPEMSPVIVTGDLREPGNAFYRGRHWAFGMHGTFGAGTNYASLRFEVDMLITRMVFTPVGGGGQSFVYYTAPTESPAVAVTTNCGVWIDRKRITTDLVPLTFAGPAALTGVNFSNTNTLLAVNAGAGVVVQGPMMWCPAGSALNWFIAAAGSGAFTVWGRVAEQVG